MSVIPSLEEFRHLATQGNIIPVCREVVADMETPVSAYRKLAGAGRRPNSFLLESVEGGENIARYSFLGVEPLGIFRQEDGIAAYTCRGVSETIEGADIFAKIGKMMERYRPATPKCLPPFCGGAVGYVSYDVISEVENSVPPPPEDPVGAPEAWFVVTDTLLAFDRVRHTIKIIAQAIINDDTDPEDAYKAALAKIDHLAEALKKPLAAEPVSLEMPTEDPVIDSNKSRDEYESMVERIKRYIVDGDIIQSVISQRFETEFKASPLALHRALRMLNPSPYMFLLDCGDDLAIVGASPEVHAKCEDGKITVRPIAGTRKRGATPERDDALADELLADPKERAEHIMLVDLARNDIGRVAATGSVNCDELMIIERYSHVMHIVSNVTGKLKPELKADAVMRATFPAGTLSGAPKVRAMQIISELEREKRGPYGGAVAYYSFNGNVDSCITIRTAVLKGDKAFVQSGAGIVADSVPEHEYEETRSKARAMMRALEIAARFDD